MTPVLDHGATVLRGDKARVTRPRKRGVIRDSLLQPDGASADRYRVINDGAGVLGTNEHVNKVHLPGDVAQRGVGTLAKDFVRGLLHWHGEDSVALPLEVCSDAIRRTRFTGVEADDGYRPGSKEGFNGGVHGILLYARPGAENATALP
jgi:hypothetical protein